MRDRNLEAAKKRLNRVLADEELGPALARLNRKQETAVLDLIFQNRMAEARRLIRETDTKRRKRRTVIDRARRYARKGARQRVEERMDELDWLDSDPDLETEFWREYDRSVG